MIDSNVLRKCVLGVRPTKFVIYYITIIIFFFFLLTKLKKLTKLNTLEINIMFDFYIWVRI